jgi:orotidine-5'-phosphate decarboxylase
VAVRAPIAVALDAPNLATLRAWAAATAPSVSTLKVGLETFLRDGRAAVATARAAAPEAAIFLDLKLHDIPATVGGAARALSDLEPDFLTVHAAGGAAMIEAAVAALPGTRITAVTILTSLSEAELVLLGWGEPVVELVQRLALVAVEAGARAIVCSPLEVSVVRAAVGADVVLITPGVRPVEAAAGDQARVATPVAAIAAGADLLVIGRPITAAPDPGAAAAAIAAELNR